MPVCMHICALIICNYMLSNPKSQSSNYSFVYENLIKRWLRIDGYDKNKSNLFVCSAHQPLKEMKWLCLTSHSTARPGPTGSARWVSLRVFVRVGGCFESVLLRDHVWHLTENMASHSIHLQTLTENMASQHKSSDAYREDRAHG